MNIATLLDIPAAIHPDCEILIDTANDSRRTYQALQRSSAELAAGLRDAGVEEGDRVGILATNGGAYVEALFAVAMARGIAVPMNYRAKLDEVTHLIRDSQTQLVFADERYEPLVAAAGDARVVRLDALEGLRRHDVESWPVPEARGSTACLVYTSGTSSLPKGVELTHEALSGYVLSMADPPEIVPQGVSLIAAPLYHVAGLTSLLVSLFAGRQVVLLPQFETTAWLRAVAEHRITQAFLVPTMLAKLLDDPELGERDLGSLESISYGAAPMPPSVLERAIAAFPHVAFTGAYGQTETTSTVTVLVPADHQLIGTPAEIERKRHRLRSVGRPLPTVELRIVGKQGEPLPALEPGEVQVRSDRHMAGYWGQASNDARVRVGGDGWLSTGDIGYLDDDGYLFLVGRAGDLIIRGGENIAPQEIEEALHRHPAVAEAAALGLHDEEWGQRVVAAVSLRPGTSATEQDLLDACSHLASFKRPECVVILDELPRTSTGKIIRREIPHMLETTGVPTGG